MKKETELAFALGIALLAFGLGASSLLAFPFDVRDEGYLYYVASAINRGELLYADIGLRSYLAGPFQVVAALFERFGPSVAAARILMVAGFSLTALLTYFASRRVAPPVAAGAAALAVALVPGPWQKFYVGLLQIALLLACFVVLEKPSRGRALLLGALVGLAWWIRLDSAVAGTALLALVVGLSRVDRGEAGRVPTRAALTLFLVIGTLVGAAPGWLWLVVEGVGEAYLVQVGHFLGSIVVRATPGSGLAPPAIADLFVGGARGLVAWIFFGALAMVAAAVGGALWTGLRRPFSAEGRLGLVLAFWLLSNVPQFALERPDVAHLTQRGVAVAVAVAFVAARARGSSRSVSIVPARAVMTVCALYALLYAGKHVGYGEGGANFFRDRAEVVVLSNGLRFPDSATSKTAALVEGLLSRSEPGAQVANWPYHPGLNFLAERSMPGPAVFLIPENVSSEVQRDAIRALDDEGVRHVFYAPEQAIHVRPDSAPSAFMPLVHATLRRDFRVVMQGDGVQLLERLPRSAPGSEFGNAWDPSFWPHQIATR